MGTHNLYDFSANKHLKLFLSKTYKNTMTENAHSPYDALISQQSQG